MQTDNDLSLKALELHKKHGGKLEVISRVPLETVSDLSLAYTPGVAAVCRATAEGKKNAQVYTLKKNTVAVVSDGSAVLGLGNIGPYGAIPVMEGKAALFKRFADIDAFPICLATQNTEEIIKAVKLIAPVFGAVNLEDISAPRCFEIEERLQKELDIPVMHDDEHGTAVVVLAGIINAIKLRGLNPASASVVINGAGAAGIAVCKILLAYGFSDIVVCDSRGAILAGRSDLSGEKSKIALATNKQNKAGQLEDVVRKADIFIGLSKAGLLKGEMVKSMNRDPIVFALANPVPEILPVDARAAGAFIVATGRSDFPNQVNNALAFPGIFRGALENKIRQFDDQMFLRAAEYLADCASNPTPQKILPSIFDSCVVPAVSRAIQ